MAAKFEVGLTLAAGVGFTGVLDVVEHKHVTRRRLGGDHTGILWHISRQIFIFTRSKPNYQRKKVVKASK